MGQKCDEPTEQRTSEQVDFRSMLMYMGNNHPRSHPFILNCKHLCSQHRSYLDLFNLDPTSGYKLTDSRRAFSFETLKWRNCDNFFFVLRILRLSWRQELGASWRHLEVLLTTLATTAARQTWNWLRFPDFQLGNLASRVPVGGGNHPGTFFFTKDQGAYKETFRDIYDWFYDTKQRMLLLKEEGSRYVKKIDYTMQCC